MDAVVGGGMVGNARTSVTAKRGLQDLEEMRRIMGASEEEEVSKCFPELELAEKPLTMEVAHCGDERFKRSRSTSAIRQFTFRNFPQLSSAEKAWKAPGKRRKAGKLGKPEVIFFGRANLGMPESWERPEKGRKVPESRKLICQVADVGAGAPSVAAALLFDGDLLLLDGGEDGEDGGEGIHLEWWLGGWRTRTAYESQGTIVVDAELGPSGVMNIEHIQRVYISNTDPGD
ncbi:hypothetical protein BKA70DRAFT_1576819 [Coprinopsis sp. MPI-PUGE-AT-0042]|nr:hypothetical protein BKA70DRAFT_1576819 [Coprinopsis sp. MPI-PUGE-AT-0042]